MTSLETLLMGVPVVTLPLDSPVSRQTASFLQLLGLSSYVASNKEDYIAIAAGRAADIALLAETRNSLRLRVEHFLCDGNSFMEQVEEIYQAMWEKYCTEIACQDEQK